MSTRNITFSVEEFYHIYNRGVDKRDIFLDDEDRDRFIRLLFVCNSFKPLIYKDVRGFSFYEFDKGEEMVAIGAYCLMPNHFHILIREIKEGGTVKFMSKLLTSYSSYFNRKYDRTGTLFEGAFKASHLNRDEYLKYIFSYIHLNLDSFSYGINFKISIHTNI